MQKLDQRTSLIVKTLALARVIAVDVDSLDIVSDDSSGRRGLPGARSRTTSRPIVPATGLIRPLSHPTKTERAKSTRTGAGNCLPT